MKPPMLIPPEYDPHTCREQETHQVWEAQSKNQLPFIPLGWRIDKLLLKDWPTAAQLLQSCPTLWPHGLQPTSLLHPCDSPRENTGVACHALLQGRTDLLPCNLIDCCATSRYICAMLQVYSECGHVLRKYK